MSSILTNSINDFELFTLINSYSPQNITKLISSNKTLKLARGIWFSTLSKYNKDNISALHYAVISKRVDIVEFLLDIGLNVNIIDKYGSTPLHYASSIGYIESVKVLIESGADINVTNISKETPILKAASNGHTDVVRLLLSVGADFIGSNDKYPIFEATMNGHTDIVRLLLKAGANVNTKNDYGWTLLHWAACDGYIDIVRLLLDAGADKNVKIRIGPRTPLEVAISSGHDDIVELLR